MELKNKGFVLTEFLISATIIMVLFSSVFVLVSSSTDKKKRDLSFIDVDSTYFLFHIRKLYINEEFDINEGSYITLYDGTSCNYLKEEKISFCNTLMNRIGAEEVILTTSNIKKLRSNYNSGLLKAYINYLPNKNNNYLRLIMKTKNGYATSNLHVDLKTDTEGPSCAFNDTRLDDEQVLVLNCIDYSEFNNSDIEIADFDTNDVSIESIEKEELEGVYGYSYAIKVDKVYNFTITLKENVLTDIYDNSNLNITIEEN